MDKSRDILGLLKIIPYAISLILSKINCKKTSKKWSNAGKICKI